MAEILEVVTVRVDGKGRIVIPRDIRRKLNTGRWVRLRVEDGRIVLEPVKDPLDELAELVVWSGITASREPGKVSRVAEQELARLERDLKD